MDYAKLEKDIVDDYLRHVVSISCSLEEKLEKAGVDTLGFYEFAKDLEWELLEHFNANDNPSAYKTKENDIGILIDKAGSYFQGKMSLSEERKHGASYDIKKDTIKVSRSALCQIVAGPGRHVVLHELRHADKKHSYSTIFVEGDSEYSALKGVSLPPSGVRELLENYLSIEDMLNLYEDSKKNGKVLDGILFSSAPSEGREEMFSRLRPEKNYVYHRYLFSPAVIHFLENRGHGEKEIEAFFRDCGGNKPYPPLWERGDKQRLLDKIEAIRPSSATSQEP